MCNLDYRILTLILHLYNLLNLLILYTCASLDICNKTKSSRIYATHFEFVLSSLHFELIFFLNRTSHTCVWLDHCWPVGNPWSWCGLHWQVSLGLFLCWPGYTCADEQLPLRQHIARTRHRTAIFLYAVYGPWCTRFLRLLCECDGKRQIFFFSDKVATGLCELHCNRIQGFSFSILTLPFIHPLLG